MSRAQSRGLTPRFALVKNIVYAFILYRVLESSIRSVGNLVENSTQGVCYATFFILVVTSIIHWSISTEELPYLNNIYGYARFALDLVVAFMYIGLISIAEGVSNASGASQFVFWTAMVFIAYFAWDLVRAFEYHAAYKQRSFTRALFLRSLVNAGFAFAFYAISWILGKVAEGAMLSESYVPALMIFTPVLILVYRYAKNKKIKRPSQPSRSPQLKIP